jgi:selenocysteine lyase/cysteine desulfurase
MEDKNIIVDYRDCNEKEFVVRAGLIAMYNDKNDCDAFIEALAEFKRSL